jgi:hypothetical protein
MEGMPDLPLDWSTALKSPLVIGVPLAVALAALTWLLTEASSFFVPAKYRPAVAIALGPFFGLVTQAAGRLDFGTGPQAWINALLYGLVGGAVAVLGHDKFKSIPPFSWLARVTPGATPATPPSETKP